MSRPILARATTSLFLLSALHGLLNVACSPAATVNDAEAVSGAGGKSAAGQVKSCIENSDCENDDCQDGFCLTGSSDGGSASGGRGAGETETCPSDGLPVNSGPLHKSDRYLSGLETRGARDRYDITNIAWGFLPLSNLESGMDAFVQQATTIVDEGRSFHARIEFDAGWKLFTDYCAANDCDYDAEECKSITGEGYEYPWFAASTTKATSPTGCRAIPRHSRSSSNTRFEMR